MHLPIKVLAQSITHGLCRLWSTRCRSDSPTSKGIVEGFGQYLRGYWYHQNCLLDEAVIGWNDQTIKDFHNQTWTETDGFIYALQQEFFIRSLCAMSLFGKQRRQTFWEGRWCTQGKVKNSEPKSSFLRALSYGACLDMFRNVPFVLENEQGGFLL